MSMSLMTTETTAPAAPGHPADNRSLGVPADHPAQDRAGRGASGDSHGVGGLDAPPLVHRFERG
jgi:hypothetical protein